VRRVSPPTRRAATKIALALGSALLVRSAFPSFDLAPAIFVAWLPLLIASADMRPRGALQLGLCQGFVLGICAHAWLVRVLLNNFPTPVWGAVLALILVAVLVALRSGVTLCAVAFSRLAGIPAWLSFPVFGVAAEQLLPCAFPWTNALAVSSTPIWQQAASFGGSAAVSAWICVINGLLAEGFLRARTARVPAFRRPLVSHLTAAFCVFSAMTIMGNVLMRRETSRERAADTLTVALGHYDSETAHVEPVVTLRELSLAAQEAHGAPDLWIWPETTVGTAQTLPQLLRLERDYLRRDRGAGAEAAMRGPLLIGVVTNRAGTLENSAVLLDAETVAGSYSKHVLMPLGETSELWAGMSLPRAMLGQAMPFRPGSDSRPISVARHPLSVSICYEDILADYLFEQVARTRGEILVNLTSDRWFKGTSAVAFHFALARLSAVEHRKTLVRSTRDGVSAVVDSAGRVVASLANQPSAVVNIKVPMLPGASWAESSHAAISVCVPLSALLLLLASWLKRKRAPIARAVGAGVRE
jgi:apolipoprotein N-acyltransferase